jgi:hypothetical protein
MKPVFYTSETSEDYSFELRKCHTLDQLKNFVTEWRPFAPDAYKAIMEPPISEVDYKEYRHGALLESRGKYAGDIWAARFSAVLLPELLMRVSMIAIKYCCPFGTAWIRLKEEGYIIQRDGIYLWSELGGES